MKRHCSQCWTSGDAVLLANRRWLSSQPAFGKKGVECSKQNQRGLTHTCRHTHLHTIHPISNYPNVPKQKKRGSCCEHPVESLVFPPAKCNGRYHITPSQYSRQKTLCKSSFRLIKNSIYIPDSCSCLLRTSSFNSILQNTPL